MIYYLLSLIFIYGTWAYENSWMVAIQGNSNNTYNQHFCAGVFIKNEYVLTSAHCVDKRLNDTEFTLHTQIGTPDHRSYPINKNFIKIHPEWLSRTDYPHLTGDLALIKVPSLAQNSKVMELELPAKSYYPNAYFDNCTVSGWKFGSEESTTPKSAPINVISINECYSVWREYAEVGRKICTRNDFDQECPEDPSTVLVCNDYQLNKVLTGIASFGPLFCGSGTMPAVFTNTAMHLYWILEVIYEMD